MGKVLKCYDLTLSSALNYLGTISATTNGASCLNDLTLANPFCVPVLQSIIADIIANPTAFAGTIFSKTYNAPKDSCSCAVQVNTPLENLCDKMSLVSVP